MDISFLNLGGAFYFLISVLDGYSCCIVRWEIREKMEEQDVEVVVARALEKHPGVKPRIISDNGPQFIAKDFKIFIRVFLWAEPCSHEPLVSTKQREVGTVSWHPKAGMHPS